MAFAICFYLTITLCGVMAYPLSLFIFSNYRDKGFQASKILGALIPSYFVWFLSTVFGFRFSFLSCLFATLIFGVVCWIVLLYWHRELLPSKIEILRALALEAVFLILFLFFTYLRCYRPGLNSTEKYMDFGFVAAFMRADVLPVNDIWFSGSGINYYYFGHYFTAFLLKLSGTDVNAGYNLMLSLLGSFAFVLPYAIVRNLLSDMKRSNVFSRIGGTFAGLLVCFSGNMHYTLYRAVIPFYCKIFGIEDKMESIFHYNGNYSFSNSTRFIGYYPDVPDKTIHEMPSYSLILGDLHAHFINIIFVLVLIMILYAWVGRKEKNAWIHTVMLSFLLGIFSMTNYWDFPIYYVVCGAVILFETLIRVGFRAKGLLFTGILGVLMFAVAKIVSLPFTLNFNKMFAGIGPTTYRSPIWQLLILWGIPFILSIFFIVSLSLEVTSDNAFKAHKNQGFFRFLTELCKPDLFIMLLLLCAMGLVLLPELIFVRDIYGESYQRANTMFKLTYQAFIIFGIAMSYVVLRSYESKRSISRIIRIACSILLVSTLFYFPRGCNEWFNGWLSGEGFMGLSATEFLKNRSESDYEIVNYINNNIDGQVVILEGTSESYSEGGRISAMTGCETVIGWTTHEWLWRSDYSLKYPKDISERVNDVNAFYMTYSLEECKEFVEKYDVDYVYVGDYERERYVAVNDYNILQLGTLVYAYEGTYLVKTDR